MSEKEILDFWEKEDIFSKTLENKQKDYIFYEGPPSANGRPGIHHCETRAYKDAVCRYFTMKGYRVKRKAGWDTQGLPIETQTAKELNLSGKNEIEKYGIEKFNQKCREIVWGYKKEWEEVTKRFGFWLDMKKPYITYEADYIAKLWEVFKKISERKIDNKSLVYKDYKVVPHCPDCETTLSSHEVAQGYRDVVENSIYVTFKLSNEPNVYLIVWTTTPWTLPANTALAIKPDAIYIKHFIDDKVYILEKNRSQMLKIESIKTEEIQGSELVYKSYEPLYSVEKKFFEPNKNDFKIYPADFVSTEDGTGIVHIAPAFGEDDFNLSKEFNLSAPITIDNRGNVKANVPGKSKFIKEADKDILEDLKKRIMLYKQENIKHTYPFCWRCDNPLVYLLKPSWFIAMSKIKQEMIKNNQTINWIPDFIKNGRFGNFLEELKDWAISRERFWGTPIPIWQCENCQHTKVIGKLDDLRENAFYKNRFILVRHGESQANTKDLIANNEFEPSSIKTDLTVKGIKQAQVVADKLVDYNVDIVYTSPYLRTKHTAELIAKTCNSELMEDTRLRELNCGIFNGKKVKEYHAYFTFEKDRFKDAPPEAESLKDVRIRMYDFIKEINQKYQNKTIVIVSHGDPLQMMEAILNNLNLDESFKPAYFSNGEIREIEYKNYPSNHIGELDLHRPFTDEIYLKCEKCENKMKRIPEVLDVWFDSGAMPFGSGEYSEGRFPADFISEAIDQTRGWFYTLLAISTALELGPAYKNVITLGLVLDKNGKKMSKSRGNIILPMEMMEKYSADTLRFYFYTVNQPAELKKFDENDLKKIERNFIATWKNTVNFYNTYVDLAKVKGKKNDLDCWILALNQKLIDSVDVSMQKYDLVTASREIAEFMDNLTNWYIRRNRKRLEKEFFETLKTVLINTAIISAPFVPFVSEYVYQAMKADKKSVHLESYPKNEENYDKEIIKNMEMVRNLATMGLGLRAKEGIKVRQPLFSFTIDEKYQLSEELQTILAEEINVKKIIKKSTDQPYLNLQITPELKKEGDVAELVRKIQTIRKDKKLKPGENTNIKLSGSYIAELSDQIKKIEEATYSKITLVNKIDEGETISLGENKIVLQFNL